MPNDIIDCPALHHRSNLYPARFRDRVPETVRIVKTVRPDPIIRMCDESARSMVAEATQVYKAWTNSHGAVAAVLFDGRQLGLMPDEFEVVSWHAPSPP